ncbi:DsbA family oxidoreductase [Marinomonas mediterranea]|jgi:Predicted dithiol-disulfide isomerase involved in polyketide biosynthesis|uniref:DSBA oxidoreductase n=1 Tax=Marinomonas mediterranea (strain ATCC 700492 / JCM 21426 / NBRC 103028 / MMB-1) TaxID=717774 RepID=F2JY23_MARM1|nr:DsbA family oxidoreductase [Marinomonas mediterranea]ADZ90759.1 DSBA oxidoreductase [Marinomonas mediterranea MMB-1]WCN08800.1 DsbA family oxidoreductase [Marinomonas mediterranea]WCN12846.1 DsbA family oxidoreductase [Marinomonas mediterranea]WCN16914.1 DsbA family oxidoreductase [Marinomonas mediterranea MMB-1]
MADIRIDIIADYVCPWCYLGYNRLNQAIEQLGDDYKFDLRWQPFELHPEIPAEGVDRDAYLSKKFGSQEKLNEVSHALQQIGQQEGLIFNFSEDDIVPNTFLAHQLMTRVKSSELSTAVALALFDAYFAQGINIGDKSELIKIAKDAGVGQSEIDNLFCLEDQVLTEKKLKHLGTMGINSVPTYVVNDQFMIQGAHSAESLFKTLYDIIENEDLS